MSKVLVKREDLSKVFQPGDVRTVETLMREHTAITDPADMPPPATDLPSAIALLNAIRLRLIGDA